MCFSSLRHSVVVPVFVFLVSFFTHSCSPTDTGGSDVIEKESRSLLPEKITWPAKKPRASLLHYELSGVIPVKAQVKATEYSGEVLNLEIRTENTLVNLYPGRIFSDSRETHMTLPSQSLQLSWKNPPSSLKRLSQGGQDDLILYFGERFRLEGFSFDEKTTLLAFQSHQVSELHKRYSASRILVGSQTISDFLWPIYADESMSEQVIPLVTSHFNSHPNPNFSKDAPITLYGKEEKIPYDPLVPNYNSVDADDGPMSIQPNLLLLEKEEGAPVILALADGRLVLAYSIYNGPWGGPSASNLSWVIKKRRP